MGKRNRRERRAHQQERAAAAGDVPLLRAFAERDPRLAASAVQRALGTTPADPAQAAELDDLAVSLAGKLRRRGDLAPALALAAAGQRRTPAFRLEEALAAFASGRDESAAQIAGADAAVNAAIGPLLQAVRGEVAVAPLRSTAPADLRALHAAARAVAHVVRGEPDEAAAIVKRIPVAARGRVLGEEIRSAADLLVPDRAMEALELLHDSERVTADVRRGATAEAALEPEDLLSLPDGLDAEPILRARALRAQLATAPSPGAIVDLVRRVGVEAFEAPQRAAAALYHGFALLRTDPAAAARSLDRAVQLGGDLIEALRGKMIGAGGAAPHVESPRIAREAAAAADRLARALERRPLGGPLAAVAGAIAAERWLDAEDARAARASIARARPLAGGKLLDELDLHEADATAYGDLKAAEQRIDALLARSPDCVAAWKMKAELAVAQGDRERADAVVLEASAATKDPQFAVLARAVRGKRGTVVPFEGFVPGAASAGALASELALATREGVDPFPLAAPYRAALGPAARLAFDAAALVIAVERGAKAASEQRLRDALLAWRRSPEDLHRVVAVAVRAGLADLIPAAALALGDDAPALRACAEALGAAGESTGVRRLLPIFAARLSRQEVTLFKALAAGKQQLTRGGVPQPEEAVRELDLALAPDFSIADFLRAGEGRGDEGVDLDDDLAEDFLVELLEMLGLSQREIDAFPPDVLHRMREKLRAILLKGRPKLEEMDEIVSMLLEIGVDMPSLLERQRRTAKKKR